MRYLVMLRKHRDEDGSTLIEVLIAALLGVLVMVLVSTLMFNTQTYVNRQVATSQVLASAASSMNKVVDSLDNAQPLGWCPSSSAPLTTPYDQCPHVSEEGASLWAATPSGACWFTYLSSTSAGVVSNPSLDGQAPDLQCIYEVPYTHVASSNYPPPQDQYDLWVVSWPASNSSAATYTSCQPLPTSTPSGCWSQSGLTVGGVPTTAPSCSTVATVSGSASCPPQQQLIARVYSPSTEPVFTYWDASGCQLGTNTSTNGCTTTPLPSSSSCLTNPPNAGAPWSGCLSTLEQVTSVRIDLHLRAAEVNGNYGTGQSGPHSQATPVLGTVDQQLQLEATLFGQAYYQQQTAVS